jgi:hypothetical protein
VNTCGSNLHTILRQPSRAWAGPARSESSNTFQKLRMRPTPVKVGSPRNPTQTVREVIKNCNGR